jgi:hypothetical protein
LASIMPAPLSWRSFCTSFAEKSAMGIFLRVSDY